MTRTLYACAALILAAGSAEAAGFDCGNFEKNSDGTWHVLRPLQIRGPRGRIDFTPDETYKEGEEKMGLDMAKLLKMNCDKK